MLTQYFNADEIFEMAEQIERNGAKFYRRAAEQVTSPDGSELLLNLAVMEDVHEKTFILAGVGPLKSPGMARYMKNNVPGILVPDEIIDRMTAAGKPWAEIPKEELTKEDKSARSQAWRETGIQICIDLIRELREVEGVAGVHIMAIEWEEAVKPIAEGAGLLPRPVLEPITA